MITVEVALVNANSVNSCLHVIPGTHKTQMLAHKCEGLSRTGTQNLT